MLRRTLGTFVLLTFVLSPMAAFAASGMLPEGKWWRNPRVIKQLNLTEEQVEAMEAVFIEHSRELMKLRSAVKLEQFELEVLIDRREIDRHAINGDILGGGKTVNEYANQH